MSFGLSHGRPLDVSSIGIDEAMLGTMSSEVIDPRAWFDHPERPLEIEIGSGKGTFLLQQSQAQPETNFLGFEWAGEFYRYAADRFRRRQSRNVKLVYGDATSFLAHRCADGVARVIHLYFSDPWPKKRHHKRRVVQDHTMAVFQRVLEAHGELRIVTDHDDLWAWMTDHAARHAVMFKRCDFEPPASAGEGEVVGSNFERKYRREGRPFHAMTLRKRG